MVSRITYDGEPNPNSVWVLSPNGDCIQVNLHVITVATHDQGYFKTLLQSAEDLMINLVVLGWKAKWEGFGMKLRLMKKYIEQVDESDVVMLMDAFDTILLQPADVIASRYLRFGYRFVAGGEQAHFYKKAFHNCMFRTKETQELPWPEPLARSEQKKIPLGTVERRDVDFLCIDRNRGFSRNANSFN